MTTLLHELVDLGARFQLIDNGGVLVPLIKWGDHNDAETLAGTAVLAALEQSGKATLDPDESTIFLDATCIASLDDSRARLIGLPAPVSYALEIDSRGAFGQMRLLVQWLDGDRLRVRNVVVNGATLSSSDGIYRLASPLFEIHKAVKTFNDAGYGDASAQADGWATIQELIGIDPEQVRAGRFLQRIRVARANGFTLDFVSDDTGSFQIAPVPLARRSRGKYSEDESRPIIEPEPARILSSVEQARFQKAFASRRGAQAAYLGGDDVYVLVTPDVRRCLGVVRDMQDRSPDERLAFARNPYPFLQTEGQSDATVPFVESRSFSDRVLGLGRLENVTLPWQILGSQGWLPPENVSVQLPGEEIRVKPESIEPAIVDIEHAIGDGSSEVTVEDHELPATEATRDAFLAARMELDQRAALEQPTKPTKSDSTHQERVGLQVKRNLDVTSYATFLAARASAPLELPAIDTRLKEHQSSAVAWLQNRWIFGYRGALLADDMGLGKTLSALMFMMWVRQQMLDGAIPSAPMLIVAPVSLLENWIAEHRRHVGDHAVRFIDIVRAYGSTLPRQDRGRDVDSGVAMLDLNRLTVDRFGKPTCVLTTYETLRDYQQSFASVRFSVIVLDEVQRIKNPASLVWHAASALHGDFWLALTGTPVENRLADLWAIADVIQPNLLGSLRTFSSTYEAKFDETALRDLKALLESSDDGAPFMLRRMKEHVLEGLPAKHEHLRPLAMPGVQQAAYLEAVSQATALKSRGQMLAIIQDLREISLHPLVPNQVHAKDYIASSSRFVSLFAILDDVKEMGEKALVFVDRNLVEAYLARLIQARYSLVQLPSIINGEVQSSKRQKLVDSFQLRQGFDVMILSPKAGGVGLTLTAANHVIHLSRWWNPAVEDQSTDRAYRIGQGKPVHVYYLQATLHDRPQHSFDERLHALLSKKRAVSRDLLWPFQTSETDAQALAGLDATPA